MTRRRALTGLAGAAALIAGITVLSRVVGFGRWAVQSYAVGATETGTAYATANQLPNVLFEVVAGGALAGAVVPLLAGPLSRGMRQDVDRTASALLTWAVAVLLPCSLLLALLARPLVEVLIQDGEPATVDLAADLVVVFAPQVLLYGIGVVLTGVLQAQRRFAWPAAAPLASSLVVIGSYLVFRELAGRAVEDPASLSTAAVAWLGWGTTAGVAALSLPLLLPVVRSGVRLRPTLAFPPGVARRARHLAFAGLGGLVAQQVSVLVTFRLANDHGGAGAINLFQYAQAVYFLPYAVLAVPLATAAFPRLAEHAAVGDHDRYARLVSTTTRGVLLVSAAGAAALAAAAPFVAEVFASIDASRDPEVVAAMGPTVTVLAPGLLGFALIFQLSRVLFAREHGRAAVVGVAAGWAAVVVAQVVAVRVMVPARDVPGTLLALALGNTIGMVVAGAVLLVAVARVAGRQAVAGVPRTLLVAGLGGLVGAGAGRLLADTLPVQGSILVALLAGVLGAVVGVATVVGAAAVADRRTVAAAFRRGRPDGGAAPQDGPDPTPGSPQEDTPDPTPTAPQEDTRA